MNAPKLDSYQRSLRPRLELVARSPRYVPWRGIAALAALVIGTVLFVYLVRG